MLNNIFMISLSMSAVILLLLIVSPLLNKRYTARWRYFVWLIVALRLIIPFKLELPSAPVNIPAPQNQTVVFRTEGMPFTIMDESFVELGNASLNSADYAPIITLQELIAIIWATGLISFFIYHIISYIIFTRKIKPYCSRLDTEIICNVLEDMKIKKKPQLLECSRIASPMMIGFFSPTILLPNTDYSDEELTVILKHELTHYKRGDLWYKLLLIIANAMHWFNPFVYLMVKAANRDLEYSCDDMVIRNSDINFRKGYSMTILKAMENGKTTTLSTSFSESGKSAKKRFENILNTKAKKTGILAFVSILIIIGIIGVFVGFNANNYLYLCKTFECSFELPESWEGKYEVQERNNNIVYVYHKEIRKTYGEGTGLLFYIEMLEGGSLTHDDITDPGNRTIALQEDGYTYVFGMPTDVQYPVWEGGDKALADDYVKMTKDHGGIKKSIRRAANEKHTAVLIRDADIFDDDGEVIITLKKNDLVYVIYDQNDGFCYVQPASSVMNIPATEGYIAKASISFDEDDYENANYGSVLTGTIYKTTNENDIYQTNYTSVFYIVQRDGEWAKVNLIGGDDGKWVKASDISYDITPYTIGQIKYFDKLGITIQLPENKNWIENPTYSIIDEMIAQVKYYDKLVNADITLRVGKADIQTLSEIYYSFDGERDENWSTGTLSGEHINVKVQYAISDNKAKGVLVSWNYKGFNYTLWGDISDESVDISPIAKTALYIAENMR